jgi:CubicO group peptidase (beta-lactamase class C family)
MRRNVLAPLGLNDSFFGTDTTRLQNSATRYDPRGRPIPHDTTATPASGPLYASAHDLARFAIFTMRHRDTGQAAILSVDDIDELHRPVFTGPSGEASTFGWLMGHTASGVPFYFKSDGDPGVARWMCFVPSKDVAVTNQSNAGELAYRVVDEWIANRLPDSRRPVEDCLFPSKPFIATSGCRDRWQGLLENDGASTPIQLNIESNEAATLTIGSNRAEVITGMRAEGKAFTGVSTG